MSGARGSTHHCFLPACLIPLRTALGHHKGLSLNHTMHNGWGGVVVYCFYNNKHQISAIELCIYLPLLSLLLLFGNAQYTNLQASAHSPPGITTLQMEIRLPLQFSFVLEMPSLSVLRPSEVKMWRFLPSNCKESGCGCSSLPPPASSSQATGTPAPGSRCSTTACCKSQPLFYSEVSCSIPAFWVPSFL